MAAIIIVALIIMNMVILEWGPRPSLRWAEGWLIPHSKPKEKCWVKCGTCEVSNGER